MSHEEDLNADEIGDSNNNTGSDLELEREFDAQIMQDIRVPHNNNPHTDEQQQPEDNQHNNSSSDTSVYESIAEQPLEFIDSDAHSDIYAHYSSNERETNDDAYSDDDDEDDEGEDDLYAEMSDTDDYETLAKPESINFDVSLPATHNYLGVQFDDVSAPKVFHQSDDKVTIPVLALPGTQLLPGQTIPLRIYLPYQINMIKNRIENSNGDPTIGFIIRPDFDSNKEMIGILAEIISCNNEDESNEQWTSMLIKVKGRERFRILKYTVSNSCMIADVEIMPEFEAIKNPLRMLAPKNTRSLFDSFFKLKKPGRSSVGVFSLANAGRLNATRFPAWLYRQYDCKYLMEVILKELSETNEVMSSSNAIPKEPTLFSNWLLNNFPFDDQLRLNILKLDCINQRLRYIYSILKQYSSINCRNCRSQLCQKDDVFSMCAQGFMSAYMNPHGHIHETLTVYKAKNLNLIGRPSTEFSWFPGYAWTICQCKSCGSHIGWKFTATKEHLKPEKFWGLTRKAVCHTNNSIQKPKSKLVISSNRDHQYSSQVSAENVDGEAAQQRDDDPWMPVY